MVKLSSVFSISANYKEKNEILVYKLYLQATDCPIYISIKAENQSGGYDEL